MISSRPPQENGTTETGGTGNRRGRGRRHSRGRTPRPGARGTVSARAPRGRVRAFPAVVLVMAALPVGIDRAPHQHRELPLSVARDRRPSSISRMTACELLTPDPRPRVPVAAERRRLVPLQLVHESPEVEQGGPVSPFAPGRRPRWSPTSRARRRTPAPPPAPRRRGEGPARAASVSGSRRGCACAPPRGSPAPGRAAPLSRIHPERGVEEGIHVAGFSRVAMRSQGMISSISWPSRCSGRRGLTWSAARWMNPIGTLFLAWPMPRWKYRSACSTMAPPRARRLSPRSRPMRGGEAQRTKIGSVVSRQASEKASTARATAAAAGRRRLVAAGGFMQRLPGRNASGGSRATRRGAGGR